MPNHTLRIIDDFLPTEVAQRVRGHALRAEYSPWYTPGTSDVQVRRASLASLPEVVQALGRVFGREALPAYTGFRIDYDGELPNSPVHFDGDVSALAAVYYLNPPDECRGGTAFWRHQATGCSAVPLGADAPLERAYRLEGNSPDPWHLESLVGMRWNRCVIYPTRYFHSRWPLEGFGTTPPTGRLVAGVFFNLGDPT